MKRLPTILAASIAAMLASAPASSATDHQSWLILDQDALQSYGLTSLGDILQRLPISGSAMNARDIAGDGSSHVSLRNLGTSRTLVLVNGLRWVGTGTGGSVDLNSIPLAAVESIQILKDGASAIYGSDAVAGVVDIRLKSHYTGAEASMQLGEFDEGDGRRQKHDVIMGFSGDRGNMTIAAGYVKEDPVWASDRALSAVPTFGLPATNVTFAGASGVGVNGRVIGTPAYTAANGGGILIPGRTGASVDDFRPYNSLTDGFNVAPLNHLQTPQERTSFFMDGRYQILDGVEFYTQAAFNERQSEQVRSASPLSSGAFAGSAFNPPTLSASSLYNPFGVDVSWARRVVETGGRTFNQDVDTYRFLGGVRGDLQFGERFFAWDVGYQYGKSERIDQNHGVQSSLALGRAIGPSFLDAGGVARCGTPTAVIAGCVPFNPFAPEGRITPEMLSYIGYVEQSVRGNDLTGYWATLSGQLFEIVDERPVTFAAGYDYRRESAFDQPDAFTNAGLGNGAARPATSGGFNLDEFLLELHAPLLADLPFAHRLDVRIAARHSDYSTFGDTTSTSTGFTWQPIEDLALRGSWSDSFRAPSVDELFRGEATRFDIASGDPCAWPSILSIPADARQRCIADGVPDDGSYVGSTASIPTPSAGEPLLRPESARTRGAGATYRPRALDGLGVSVDWYRIDLSDSIAHVSPGYALNACYLADDPALRAQMCPRIQRTVGGLLTSVGQGPANVGRMTVEGWDLAVDLSAMTAIGALQARWLSTYTSDWTRTLPAADLSMQR